MDRYVNSSYFFECIMKTSQSRSAITLFYSNINHHVLNHELYKSIIIQDYTLCWQHLLITFNYAAMSQRIAAHDELTDESATNESVGKLRICFLLI